MRTTFERAGVALPAIPAALGDSLRELGPWVFSTRDVEPMAMYLFGHYVVEAVADDVDDYVAVCHAGHGINSYALSYHLVHGPLALFVQSRFGGAYQDSEADRREIARRFDGCRELIDTVDELDAMLPSRPARLVVVQSDFRGAACCEWLDAPLGDQDAAWKWLRDHNRTGTQIRVEGGTQRLPPFDAIAAAIETVGAAEG